MNANNFGLIDPHDAMEWLFPNPANKAMPYLDQIQGQISPYYQPYSDRGQRLGGQLESQYGQQANNPNDFYNQISSGYKESPGFQTRMMYAQSAAGNAARASGMGGSPQHMLQSAQIANDLSGKDFEDYLGHVFGLQQRGQQGLQGLQTQGYGAGNELATALAGILQNKAGLSYSGQESQNTMLSQILQSLINGGAKAAGAAAGGAGGGAGM
jgi:hypothetical protein